VCVCVCMRPWACVWRSCERSVWANHSCFFLFSLSSVFQSFLIIILHANCRLASRFEKRSRVKSQGPARVRMIARQVHAWPHGHGWTVRQQALSRFTHPGRGCHARSVDAVESIRSHIRSLRYEPRHHIRARLSTCSNCPIQIWPRPRPNRTHVRYRN
jgi:hypothetical protein